MAARAEATVRVDEDSSSSDDEALKRCQEAVWETRGDERKRGDTGVQQTKRVVVADHEHDGNELQVTEGFRTHVAKKLGSLLDRCITEIQTETSSCASEKCDDDEGFLLFSTSVPGQTADDPPAPARRRPVPSSSDSDSEMETRLKEAAVSVKDLLPSLSLSAPSAEPPCSDKVKEEKKAAEEEESVVKKRKKKRRKQSEGERDSAGSLNAQSNDEHRSSEQEHMLTKKKKKKKQQQDGNTEEEALN